MTRRRHAGAPWASALGHRVEELSPALQAYFGGAPYGSHGIGEGVFTTVGTPRRLLWPLLAVLGRWNVVWPVWAHNVPFTIANVPTPHGLIGVRRFRFADGDRTMTDRISWTSRGLRQRLGAGERIVAELHVEPEDGGLRITSGRVGIRAFGLRFSLPASWAPRIEVHERTLADGRQHVALTLDLPLVGRAYEYAGAFEYRIEPVAPGFS
ncbi:DUF4166 domain-containing protein [Protaetiibacter intestinalis]|uniref:DUF4166 domain-containing protein n=1 Tax=Protaetiibacter intestinalis TaxID=2419774 RepID=A0A387B9P1_9MICO|nr:DUF4166 domain-containing protein [Protaetiibacter intestinalis]AYF99073.1 DUF4166 domain-containing protein [Protaetiibacter intestinalis]